MEQRSNLTSPKWKNFRGSRIECQDRIRLNNVIWRTWHQQCKILLVVEFFDSEPIRIDVFFSFLDIRNKKTIVCQFVSPLDVHRTPVR